ncbi:MAG: hypothetical protein ACP5RW_00560 [bacterium]
MDNEIELCLKYAPIIMFDEKEPFLPIKVGYTIFSRNSKSSSFPREIILDEKEVYAIEYAIYWDWDIEHLYELEHSWVYVGEDNNIRRVEASWHGGYHLMDNVEMRNGHPVIYSQPGKHAFAPTPSWFEPRERFIPSCSIHAGIGGLLVTDIFKGRLEKTLDKDELVLNYLSRYAFIPTFNFRKEFRFTKELFLSWDELYVWIPKRIEEVINRLKQEVF